MGTLSGAISLVIEMREVKKASYNVSRRRRSEVEKMVTLYKTGRKFSSNQINIAQLDGTLEHYP